MKEQSLSARALTLLAAWLLPVSILVFVIWQMTSVVVEGAVVRFVNSMLTAFTLVSFMLLLILFAYGDARKRPYAPLFGMILAVLSGSLITLFFLSQGDFLMEQNGSIRAQWLSNIIRFGTTFIAMMSGIILVGGTLMASLLNSNTTTIEFEEE